MRRPPSRRFRIAALLGCAIVLVGVTFLAPAPVAAAAQPPPIDQPEKKDKPSKEDKAVAEFLAGDADAQPAVITAALIRLPYAAALGAILALRPRRRGHGRRSILVVQTQIMLAVVGAVIMLVVGDSTARAFGIVGAAGLVRYRSTIDDPKEAVVMLCALAAGLAAGVGQYRLAPFATAFMTVVLFIVEWFEPIARKYFELSLRMRGAKEFRPNVEGVLKGFALEFELLTESEDEIGYSISAPIDVRTRDISDMIRIMHTEDDDMTIEWDEKKAKK